MTLQAWVTALAVFAALITADLVFTKGAEGLRAAAVLSGLWIAAAVAFGGVLWLWQGPAVAGQYFAGRLLVLPRPYRREGVRGSALGGVRGGVRHNDRGQRAGRDDPANQAVPGSVTEASRRTG